MQWDEAILRHIGWLIWVGLTPPIIQLTRRIPFERKQLGRFSVTLILLGLGFGFLHFLLETAIKYPLWVIFIEPKPDMNEFYSAIYYRYHMNFLIFLFIAGGAYAIEHFNKSKNLELVTSRLQAQLAQAQVAALKQQLHPHFLFNVHHSIIGLVLKKENKTAIQMLTLLSDLLRVTLDLGNIHLITLRQELDILQLYLKIHQLRMGERLVVNYEIDPSVLPEPVPALILQPIVENAIKHAVEPFSRQGQILISAYVKENLLFLEVRDNGPGIAAIPHLGIGLQNTKDRLAQLYGENGKITFVNRHPGCSVLIQIPFQAVKTGVA